MNEFVEGCLKRYRSEREKAYNPEAPIFLANTASSSSPIIGLSEAGAEQNRGLQSISRTFTARRDRPYDCLEALQESSEQKQTLRKADKRRSDSSADLVSLPYRYMEDFTHKLPGLVKDTVLCPHTAPAKSRPFSVLVVDIETTGLSLKIDQIIELGCVELRWNGCDVCGKDDIEEGALTAQWVRGSRTFHRLVRPTVGVTRGAAAVHNYSSRVLETASHWREVAKDFKTFCDTFLTFRTGVSDRGTVQGGDRVHLPYDCFTLPSLIAHNAQFDSAFIEKCLMRLGYTVCWDPLYPITCTQRLARQLYPKRTSTLDHVSAYLRVSGAIERKQSPHSAYVDAIQCAKVFLHLTRTLSIYQCERASYSV